MKEGFYIYRNNIYYGEYDETKTSGRCRISKVSPERIFTNHPIKEEDWAVQLWDNHRLLEPEYADVQLMLEKMKSFMNINTDVHVDFSNIEQKLQIVIPKELKCIYTAIYNHAEYFTSVEHFLPIEDLYIEQGILVFFKKKRIPIAGYELESGCLASYYKKTWDIACGDMCCYQFCIGRMLTIALAQKQVVKKGRCKGNFVTTLNIEKEIAKFCDEKYHILSEFHVYGIAVLYTQENLIAWIRSNGFYADIHAGADRETQLEELKNHFVDIVWKA